MPASIHQNFSEIIAAALRCYGPQNVCEVLRAKAGGGVDMFESCVDFSSSRFRLHHALALGGGEQNGSAKVDSRGPVPVLVVDGLHRPFDDSYPVNGNIVPVR